MQASKNGEMLNRTALIGNIKKWQKIMASKQFQDLKVQCRKST